MTTNGRLADVQGEIFDTPASNGGFPQEQTLANTGAMTEMRDRPALRRSAASVGLLNERSADRADLVSKQFQGLLSGKNGRVLCLLPVGIWQAKLQQACPVCTRMERNALLCGLRNESFVNKKFNKICVEMGVGPETAMDPTSLAELTKCVRNVCIALLLRNSIVYQT